MFLKLRFEYAQTIEIDCTTFYTVIDRPVTEEDLVDYFPMNGQDLDFTALSIKHATTVLFHADKPELGLFIGTLEELSRFDQQDNQGHMSFEYIEEKSS